MNIDQLTANLKARKISPTQLVNQALEEIEKSKDLNIFTEVFKDSALKEAKRLEEKIANNKSLGRLAGIIFSVKDNFLQKDNLTTAAAPFLTNFKAPYTATCLQKLLDEDAILIGKVNLDAFAHGTSTENSYFGPTKNPHDPKLTPGGSSGGSAVSVASNICQFSLGTDTGGSVRLPASFCGVFGFKPTYGLLSRYGIVAMASSTDCVSILTRSVEDMKLLLDILKGQDDLDGTTIDSSRLQINSAQLPQKPKVGIIEEFNQDLDPVVEQSFNKALKTIKDLDWDLETVSLKDIKLSLACYYVLVSAEVSSNLSRYDGLRYGQQESLNQAEVDQVSANRQAGFMTENKRRIMLGTYVLSQGYYEAYYHRAQKLRTLICQQFDQAFKKYDILISPVSPTPAFALGSKIDNPVQMYLADLMTVAPSLAGIPAISLPLPSQGLPVGLQIMSPQKTDDINLKFAEVLAKELC